LARMSRHSDPLRILALCYDAASIEAIHALRRQATSDQYEVIAPPPEADRLDALLNSQADVCICDPRQQALLTAALEGYNDPMAHLPPVIVLCHADVVLESRAYPLTESVTLANATPAVLQQIIHLSLRHNHTLHALRTAKNSLWLAMRGTREGLWDWDLDAQRVLFTSTWFETLNDTKPETQASPNLWFERVHPDDVNSLQHDINAHLSGRTGILINQHRIRSGNGDYIPVVVRGLAERNTSGKPCRLVGSMSVLRVDTNTTSITPAGLLTAGLADRPELMRRVQQALARAQRRNSYQFAVFALEIERFPTLLDRVDAETANEILGTVAQRLRDGIRPMDSISHLGDERFVMFVDDITDPSDTIRLADRIQRNLRDLCVVGGQSISLSASVGIALGNVGYKNPERMLRDAEAAMIRARERGKSCYEIFDHATHERAITLLELESDVRRAIEDGEFQVYFQPVMELSSRKMEGLAARLHWEHPRRGMMSPWEFVAVAESYGMVETLADRLLTNACQHLSRWRNEFGHQGPRFVSFKLSSPFLLRLELIDRMLQALHETDLDASDLRIEISERALTHAVDESMAMLQQLRALDIELGIGDFGSGAASLLNLQRFPIDFLVLDNQLLRQCGPRADNPHVLQAVTQLGHALGLAVHADGVETPEQAQLVTTLGCQHASGGLFGPSSSPQHIADFFRARRQSAAAAGKPA
jgi:diguanylate cyclase (GGDEF)-like protein